MYDWCRNYAVIMNELSMTHLWLMCDLYSLCITYVWLLYELLVHTSIYPHKTTWSKCTMQKLRSEELREYLWQICWKHRVSRTDGGGLAEKWHFNWPVFWGLGLISSDSLTIEVLWRHKIPSFKTKHGGLLKKINVSREKSPSVDGQNLAATKKTSYFSIESWLFTRDSRYILSLFILIPT